MRVLLIWVPRLRRIKGAVFDLNDPSQTFELTQPLSQQPASATGQADGNRPDVAGLVSQAAALIIQPQAVVRTMPCLCIELRALAALAV